MIVLMDDWPSSSSLSTVDDLFQPPFLYHIHKMHDDGEKYISYMMKVRFNLEVG